MIVSQVPVLSEEVTGIEWLEARLLCLPILNMQPNCCSSRYKLID